MRKPKLTRFGKLRRKLRIDRKAAAEQFFVTERTITNWDYKQCPQWAISWLERNDRNLGGIHPKWRGFRIGWNGKLYGPNRLIVSAEWLVNWGSRLVSSERSDSAKS